VTYVGKLPGAESAQQVQIIASMIERAQAGKSVVRLKGDDPLVFRRSGEEALALAVADVPFEVVLGIKSAIAASAYARIPLTDSAPLRCHRIYWHTEEPDMQAKDLMTVPAITINAEVTIEDAARLLLERNLSCLPVVDDQGRLVGMLTHSDFGLHHKFMPLAGNLYTLMDSWANPDQLEEVSREVKSKKVRDVMKQPVTTVQEDAPIAEMARLMATKDIHRFPVMCGDELVGIVTRHDLLKLLVN